jgi:hypothetical protein
MAWGWWTGTFFGRAANAAWDQYVHRSTSLAGDAERGARVALMGLPDWDPAALRAWLSRSATLRGELTGGVIQDTDRVTANVTGGAGWRGAVANILGRTPEILADLTARPGDVVPANPTTSGGEVGAWPVAVVAVIAVGAVAAIAWCGYQAGQVIDRQLARNAAAREMVRADELAQRLVDAHLARERAAGRPLDLDESEREVLEMLLERQRLAAPHAPPLAAPAAMSGDAFGFGSILPIAVAAVVVLFVIPPLLKGSVT